MKKKIVISFIFIIALVITNSLKDRIDDSNDKNLKIVNYNGNNLRISIDGNSSNTLPINGSYYLVSYDCKNSNTKVEWDKNNYKLIVSNKTKKGGITCDLEFKSKPLLSEMPQGDFVKYVGNNGCENSNSTNGYTSCNGKNVNYESDTNMGYCQSSYNKFHENGWRIGYTKDGNAYLISAGATECVCTSSDGTIASSCTTNLSVANTYKHVNNLNNISLKYCNKDYIKDGVCITNDTKAENNTAWAMNANDFKAITGSTLSSSSCYSKYSNMLCGYSNDLIDNGGYYWIATIYTTTSNTFFYWRPYDRFVFINLSGTDNVNGVRPVLALDSSVFVTGGDGTYENPYTIGNYNFSIDDSAGKSNIKLNLSGSDVSTMCISVDTSVCTNYVTYSNNYTLDLSSKSSGEHFIYVYYKDSSGNIVVAMDKSINLE